MLVIGGGAIGMLAALLLRHYGVDDLQVAEVHEGRRTSLQRHARCATFDPRQQAVPENSFDYVIDAVGSAITRGSAMAAAKPGGVLMHIGLQDWASEIDLRKLTLAELTLLGTYTYSQADLRAPWRRCRAACSATCLGSKPARWPRVRRHLPTWMPGAPRRPSWCCNRADADLALERQRVQRIGSRRKRSTRRFSARP